MMNNLKPKGGDGAFGDDASIRLGEIYGFTNIPDDLAYQYQMPTHWYGILTAILPANKSRIATLVEYQMLPQPGYPTITLPLQDLLYWVDAQLIDVKHFASPNTFEQFNNRLKIVLTTTDEHIDLFVSNPELLEAWKIHCLYANADFDQCVTATYEWVTPQTDWFDIEASLIDWILLVRELIAHVDNPNSDDDGEGGIPVTTI
ncbi:MAG: hypothetical protein AAFN11_01745 [Chloroflexota bacterium]